MGGDERRRPARAFCRRRQSFPEIERSVGRAATQRFTFESPGERVLACDTGSTYGMVVVLLNELAKSQIELSMRAGGNRPAN